jgi:probable phosphoglycerate mutase
MLPSSVTEVVTEERKQGEAYFRTLRIGDQSHLYMAGQRPSFAARYREVYSDSGHRN